MFSSKEKELQLFIEQHGLSFKEESRAYHLHVSSEFYKHKKASTRFTQRHRGFLSL